MLFWAHENVLQKLPSPLITNFWSLLLLSCFPFSLKGTTLIEVFSTLQVLQGHWIPTERFLWDTWYDMQVCDMLVKKIYTLFKPEHIIFPITCTFRKLWECRRALSLTVLGAVYMIYNDLCSQWFFQGNMSCHMHGMYITIRMGEEWFKAGIYRSDSNY